MRVDIENFLCYHIDINQTKLLEGAVCFLNGVAENIEKIVSEFKQLPYLFIGAGFSKRYAKSPSWDELLEDIWSKLYTPTPNGYTRFKRRVADQMDIDYASISDDERKYHFNPCVASELRKELNHKCLNDSKFEQSLFTPEESEKILREDLDYFKFYIAKQAETYGNIFSEIESNEITALRTVNNKIAGVITTNYDTILETVFPQFGCLVGQSELFVSRTDNIFELYKIHGSCTAPNSIVITHEDYTEFQDKLAYLSAKLLTIFVEHPIIFIGYSIGDLNIRAILEGIAAGLTNKQRERLRHNLIFISPALSDDIEEKITTKELGLKGQSISMTEIVLRDFSLLFRAFSNIKSSLPVNLIRQLQDMLRTFISSTKVSQNIVVSNIDSPDLSGNELGVYIGTMDSISSVGFDFFDLDVILRDILFDDTPMLMNEKILTQTFKRIKSQTGATFLPVYKYLDGLGKTIEDLPRRWKIVRSYKDLQKGKFIDTYAKKQPQFSTLQEILEAPSIQDHTLRQIACIIKSSEKLSAEDIYTYLVECYKRPEVWKKNISYMKKLVALYDFKKYAKK